MENILINYLKKNKYLKFQDFFFKEDFLDNTKFNLISKNTSNIVDLYFQIIIIYYYNYLYYKNIYINNNKSIYNNKSENKSENNKKIKKTIMKIENEENINISNINSNFHINPNLYLYNEEIQYISKFQREIYKYIMMKTHPDKTNDKILNEICVLSNDFYNDNDIAILFMIAIALKYEKNTLIKKEKKLLDRNIFKYIIKKRIYI